MNINMKYGVIVPITLLLALLAGCNGGSSDPNLAYTSGDTLTITAPFGNLTFLNHVPSSLTNTATAIYNSWDGNTSGIFMQYYLQGGSITSDYISISGTSDNGTKFTVGTPPSTINCNVTASTAYPLCSSWGITVDRAKGTLDFVGTPVFNDVKTTETGTMNGTLTFPPF